MKLPSPKSSRVGHRSLLQLRPLHIPLLSPAQGRPHVAQRNLTTADSCVIRPLKFWMEGESALYMRCYDTWYKRLRRTARLVFEIYIENSSTLHLGPRLLVYLR
jgi:hypothetical protein